MSSLMHDSVERFKKEKKRKRLWCKNGTDHTSVYALRNIYQQRGRKDGAFA